MKLRNTLVLLIMSVLSIQLYAATSVDKSSIVIEYKKFGWAGINAGWDEDDCLISRGNTLDYLVGQTNRNVYPLGPAQYLIAPEIEQNWGEQINNEFTPTDKITPQSADDGTDGEIQEFWVTWDTNWIYFAVKGEMRNGYNNGNPASAQGNNIMILISRIDGFGVVDFTTLGIWKKGIYTRDFNVDMFLGVYGGWGSFSSVAAGGTQLVAFTNFNNPTQYYDVAKRQPADSKFTGATNSMFSFYNGDYEFNSDERVFLAKIKISTFTNWITNNKDLSIKVMALSVDGDSTGSSSLSFDFCPNNLAGMNSSRKSVADNFFILPFTDSAGNVRTDVSPRHDGKIVYLPGSREFNIPVITTTTIASNTLSGIGYSRTVFAPSQGEVMKFNVNLPKAANVFGGAIKIYSLRGELVTTLGQEDWGAPPTSSIDISYEWDGKNSSGNYVPMGTYIFLFSGLTEDSQAWSEKSYCTVVY